LDLKNDIISANLTAYLLSLCDLFLSNDVSSVEFGLFSSFLHELLSLGGVCRLKLGTLAEYFCPRRNQVTFDTLVSPLTLVFLLTPPRDCQMLLGRMHGKSLCTML
jgi:hypothetical protein